MPDISILSPHLADLIAAGEVVDRPASVIKELMENSIDAGAKYITVEIRGGGSTFIRVSDDGRGMAPEDAGIAFMRHATSKLHEESDLEAIGTMGFRGEALAAIAAVSRIEMSTRLRGEDEGTYISLDAGEIIDMRCTGCPEGTQITVRDIFYNTPARHKFLKSDRAEASACVSAALHCALGRPDISVRMLRDGREEFFSPGDGRIDSAIYTLLGREVSKDMLPCAGSVDELAVRGCVSSPRACRGNRSLQSFYCNGRYIQSALLRSALEQAYKNRLLSGKFPACVLYLEIPTGSVDVNVHPAKTEVKFSDERKIFNLVNYAVFSALDSEGRTETQESAAISAPSMREDSPIAPASPPPHKTGLSQSESPYSLGSPSRSYAERDSIPELSALFGSASRGYQTEIELSQSEEYPAQIISKNSRNRVLTQDIVAEGSFFREKSVYIGFDVDNCVENVEKQPISAPLSLPAFRICGELFRTYIAVELKDELLLIDKHAAHERLIFDSLRSRSREITAQMLLTPLTFRPDAEASELVEENAGLLAELGFEIEPYGPGDYIIRGIPADINASEALPALEEICDKLRRGIGIDPSGSRDELLHTLACKAAIKAGYDNSPQELEILVKAVLSGELKYCPHGRPVSFKIERKELEKLFRRTV